MRLMSFICLLCVCLMAQLFEPTYFSAMSITTDLGVGAGAMIWAEARHPNGSTGFSGYAIIHILESNPNGSAYMISETETPTETLYFHNGSGYGVIMDDEPEMISVTVYDPHGAIKNAMPIPFNFVPAGTMPVKLRANGSKRLPVGDGEGPLFFYRVEPVDALGNPVPSYYVLPYTPDAVRIRIIYEEYPATTRIYPMFSDTAGSDVMCMAFHKIVYFTLSSDSAQTVLVEISDLLGTLAPDTFQVEFINFGEIMLLSLPISGAARTVGNDLTVGGVLLGVGVEDGPYPYNDTTVVFPRLVDFHGTPSAVISPDEPRVLCSGVTGYMVSDTEPDTIGLFVKIDTEQEDIYVPFWTPLRFNPPGKATMLWLSSQPVALVNDTVEVEVSVQDDNFNIDEDYKAYVSLNFGEHWAEFSFLINDTPWIYCAESENGVVTGGITSSVPGTASIVARDCEESWLFDMGYLGNSPELYLTFVPGETIPATNYAFYQPSQSGVYPVQQWCMMSVAAVSPSGSIDINYNGTATVSATGSAEITPASGVITFNRGIANFEIRDSIAEQVQLSCTGELSSPSPLTICFTSPSEGGSVGIISFGPKPIAGAELHSLVIVMNYLGFSTYTGTATLSVDDPNMNGSVFVPPSVEINAGIGSFTMINNDAEIVSVTASMPGFQPTSVQVKTFAIMSLELPADTLPIGVADTFCILARRADGAVCANLSGEILSIFIEEEIPNNSAIVSPDIDTMYGGIATATLINSETEAVWVWINTLNSETFLTSPSEHYDPEHGWRFGPIYFGNVGVSENKPSRSVWVGPVFPSPFNSKASVSIDMPTSGNVVIEISDILGRKIAETELKLQAGIHRINLPIKDSWSSGAYWVKIIVDGKEFIRKTVLVK